LGGEILERVDVELRAGEETKGAVDLRFRMEGVLSRNFPGNTNLNAGPVKFVYGYSNGWWMAQVDGATVGDRKATGTNIRNIEGGTRTVHFVEGENPVPLRMGSASSLTHPPSESELFVVWLACTPNAKLPIKDGTHIGPLSRYGAAGTYSLWTLEESSLARRLTLTNDGTIIGPGFKKIPVAGVLSNGFKDLEFELLRWTTNRAGVRFASEAQVQRFSARADGALDALTHMRIEVRSIEYPTNPFEFGFAKIPRVMVEDSRIADPSERPPDRYIVTNDVWMSVHYLPNR
jgi:hypothetical protein